MKPAAFDYVRCDSAAEAIGLLAEHGDEARVLAGGQTLLAALNMRLAQPRVLVDISRCADLGTLRTESGMLAVGASVTQAMLEHRPALGDEVPLLPKLIPHISHAQVRSRGTVCGSIAYADPSAELPLALVALGGQVVLRSQRGRRTLDAGEFFRGMLQTAREADELIEEIRFPLRAEGVHYAFTEFAERHGDFAIVAVAVAAGREGIRFAVGGVADRPRVACWTRMSGSDLETAINDFAWELDAQDDVHASAQYRRHLVRVLGRRVAGEAGL
jgi:2-furoyl-CoA dehydrogenase FAD binding subunit